MVDVEAVFYRCFELAPLRFAWRTRADLPDYKKCAKSLRDAEARKPALLIKTGDRFGRQLTVAGRNGWRIGEAGFVASLSQVGIFPSPGNGLARECLQKWRIAMSFSGG